MPFRFLCVALSGTALFGSLVSAESRSPLALMCVPGELIFSDSFDPQTVSERWFYRGAFALRDGALLRTEVDPNEEKRVFLKDASFHNVVIQFDFKFAGRSTDLRLVTGSGGGYNSVTQIKPGHFQINTPVDREAGFVPCQLGECVRPPSRDQWKTMTVEYWEDEMVAHIDGEQIVIGSHPILDRTRKYFAFQFDLLGRDTSGTSGGTSEACSGRARSTCSVQTGRDECEVTPLAR